MPWLNTYDRYTTIDGAEMNYSKLDRESISIYTLDIKNRFR